MKEQDCTFPSSGITLAGTLALPDSPGPFPAAVFITGSGMVDRNENHKKLGLNVFNELARQLAAKGFASFRFDKRGVGTSQGDFYTSGFHDNADDARAAFTWLAGREEIDPARVFVIGHSEGAFIATRLAGSGLKTAGIVLIAGGAESGESTLEWQALQVVPTMKGLQAWLIRTLRVDVLKAQRKTLAKLKASKKDTFRMQLIARVNAKWMREFLSYFPAADLPHIQCPVLAVTGEYDIQVNPDDIGRMKELVKAPFEGHVVPKLSHILRTGTRSISDYKRQMREPIDGRVAGILLEWLERKAAV